MVYRHRTRKSRTRHYQGGSKTTTITQLHSPQGPPKGPLPTHLIVSIPPEKPLETPPILINNHAPIVLLSGPTFDAAIADAPTLSKIESTVSSLVYTYLKRTLRKIAEGDSHIQYTSPERNATEYVFVLSQILKLLTNEINTIETTYQSGDFTFSLTDHSFVLEELAKYIEYFQRNAYKWDRINTEFHKVLFQ
jgi:hypothetical protein